MKSERASERERERRERSGGGEEEKNIYQKTLVFILASSSSSFCFLQLLSSLYFRQLFPIFARLVFVGLKKCAAISFLFSIFFSEVIFDLFSIFFFFFYFFYFFFDFVYNRKRKISTKKTNRNEKKNLVAKIFMEHAEQIFFIKNL